MKIPKKSIEYLFDNLEPIMLGIVFGLAFNVVLKTIETIIVKIALIINGL